MQSKVTFKLRVQIKQDRNPRTQCILRCINFVRQVIIDFSSEMRARNERVVMGSQVVSSDHGFTVLVVWNSQSTKCELELFEKGPLPFPEKATASGMNMHQCGVSGQQLSSGDNFSYLKYSPDRLFSC